MKKQIIKFLAIFLVCAIPFTLLAISIWVANPEQLNLAAKFGLSGILDALFIVIVTLLNEVIEVDDDK